MTQLPDVSSRLGAPFGRVNLPAEFWNKPCAAAGLVSYRIGSPFGWIMIGAKDHDDAMAEARRSTAAALDRRNLEVWDATRQAYVKAGDEIPPQRAAIRFSLSRVRLDCGGYDSGGAYWGAGAPLYYATAEIGGTVVDRYFRASDREGAKGTIRKEFPGATFYR